MLTVVHDAESANDNDGGAGRSLLDEIVRDGACGARQPASAVKKLLLTSFKNGFEEQMELEGRLIAECADSADGHEGINAFLEKRRPDFD